MSESSEIWAASEAYEQFMGQWSLKIAELFLDWLKLNPQESYLDLGCGTGALSRVIQKKLQPQSLICLDYAFPFLHYAKSQVTASMIQADGSQLPIKTQSFDAVLSGIALNFIPNTLQAVKEMRRITKEGGIVAAYLWDYADKMEFLRYFWDAAVMLDANVQALHEGYRFPICQPNALESLWKNAGMKNAQVQALDAVIHFDDFEQYWQLFSLGRFPASNYARSLAPEANAALRKQLESIIPCSDDRHIQLTIRAWAISGIA